MHLATNGGNFGVESGFFAGLSDGECRLVTNTDNSVLLGGTLGLISISLRSWWATRRENANDDSDGGGSFPFPFTWKMRFFQLTGRRKTPLASARSRVRYLIATTRLPLAL